jgi:hypothetical protein
MDGASDTESRKPPAEFGVFVPGGYVKRPTQDDDRSLCLVPDEPIDVILAAQRRRGIG